MVIGAGGGGWGGGEESEWAIGGAGFSMRERASAMHAVARATCKQRQAFATHSESVQGRPGGVQALTQLSVVRSSIAAAADVITSQPSRPREAAQQAAAAQMSKRPTDHLEPSAKRGAARQLTKDDESEDEEQVGRGGAPPAALPEAYSASPHRRPLLRRGRRTAHRQAFTCIPPAAAHPLRTRWWTPATLRGPART